MNKNKTYAITLLIFLVLVASALWATNETRNEKALIKEILPHAKKIVLMKDAVKDPVIQKDFPGVERVYSVDGLPGAFITSGTGYVGIIRTLVTIDNEKKRTGEIRILEQGDTPLYADPIKESWFAERFKGLELSEYLELVVLDPEKPNEIVQVTGASISSQAVLNNVNSAIGAWNYLVAGIRKEPVENWVSQEMWEKDENSFVINWPENNSIRVNVEDLNEYSQVSVETILHKTTGTKENITASGPLLKDVLNKNGIDLTDYEGIGITGRDNYYTMISKDILQNRDIILSTIFNGEKLPREEKPVRVVIPEEMGVYWVKMVNRIDLYPHISPKNIGTIHIFDSLVEDIEPYYYEYYGSKDKSYLVGKILSKFAFVDQNGFFTMKGSDGLVKNETISMVRDRYYIKTEGDNAPMNIGPAFKLGMNVKEMICFSTTTDAVIFPKTMMKAAGEVNIPQGMAMKLASVLEEADMFLEGDVTLVITDMDDNQHFLPSNEIESAYLIPRESGADAIISGNVIKDVKRIAKIQR